jgi:hypothetical protein
MAHDLTRLFAPAPAGSGEPGMDEPSNSTYSLIMPLSIDRILAGAPQVKKDGNAFVIAEEADVVAYIALGQEVLQIAHLGRVELFDEVLLQTYKGERFYFAPEQVVGFRFGGPESKTRLGGAGFMKS